MDCWEHRSLYPLSMSADKNSVLLWHKVPSPILHNENTVSHHLHILVTFFMSWRNLVKPKLKHSATPGLFTIPVQKDIKCTSHDWLVKTSKIIVTTKTYTQLPAIVFYTDWHFSSSSRCNNGATPLDEAEVVDLSSTGHLWLGQLHSITREDHNVHHQEDHLWSGIASS